VGVVLVLALVIVWCWCWCWCGCGCVGVLDERERRRGWGHRVLVCPTNTCSPPSLPLPNEMLMWIWAIIALCAHYAYGWCVTPHAHCSYVGAESLNMWSILMPAVYQLVPGAMIAKLWFDTLFPPTQSEGQSLNITNITNGIVWVPTTSKVRRACRHGYVPHAAQNTPIIRAHDNGSAPLRLRRQRLFAPQAPPATALRLRLRLQRLFAPQARPTKLSPIAGRPRTAHVPTSLNG
jgi:hypothetical protein